MKIAFLSYEWSVEISEEFARGVQRFVSKYPDTSVHVFHGFGIRGQKSAGKGELQIFNLAYISEYDGILLQGNRVWAPELRQLVVERAKEHNVPVASFNYPLEDCIIVGQDNYSASYQITEHLIKEHDCKRIGIVAGLKSSLEAQERLRAALDCVEQNHAQLTGVYGYEWNHDAGIDAVKQMVSNHNVPDGIVCGNDDLAYGVEAELLASGYRIPEDVKIVGIDNLNYGKASPIRVSSVDRDYPGTTCLALEALRDKALGKDVPNVLTAPCKLVFSESCGCCKAEDIMSEIKQCFINTLRNSDCSFELQTTLNNALDDVQSLGEVAEVFETFVDQYKLGDTYLVMNGLYLENFDNTNPIRHYGNTMFLIGVPKRKKLMSDERHVYEEFSRKQLLPEHILDEYPSLDAFSLQAGDTCIGYVVMNQGAVDACYLEVVFTLVEHAFERVRRNRIMESLNAKLSVLYIRDSLTGLYNRFGLEQRGSILYHMLINQKKNVFVDFVDIDEMKKINDLYGHDCGDDAIVSIARIIENVCKGHDAFAMRYGGDEFVTISGCSLEDELRYEIKSLQNEKMNQYPLHASVGESIVTFEEGLTIQEAINRADDQMYEVKKQDKMKIFSHNLNIFQIK